MNYIKLLEADILRRTQREVAFFRGITELRHYLLSEKFHADTTVQVSDILRRLEDIIHAANVAEDGGEDA